MHSSCQLFHAFIIPAEFLQRKTTPYAFHSANNFQTFMQLRFHDTLYDLLPGLVDLALHTRF